VTNIQYSVDDMTGPPLNVKLWVNMEASSISTSHLDGKWIRTSGCGKWLFINSVFYRTAHRRPLLLQERM